MIEKDTGRSAIHRLRTIHLYEADYNLFLKLQWGLRLVRHDTAKSTMVSTISKSDPTKTMDPVLLKQLSYDLSCQCHTNLATFDNDALACYNRIIVALAMLAARHLHMPQNVVQTHVEALCLMHYYMKTLHETWKNVTEGKCLNLCLEQAKEAVHPHLLGLPSS